MHCTFPTELYSVEGDFAALWVPLASNIMYKCSLLMHGVGLSIANEGLLVVERRLLRAFSHRLFL